jgi:hypothetical protein
LKQFNSGGAVAQPSTTTAMRGSCLNWKFKFSILFYFFPLKDFDPGGAPTQPSATMAMHGSRQNWKFKKNKKNKKK